MNAYVVDTETTGEEPVAEVIELAVGRMDGAHEPGFECEPVFEGRFKPTGRIRFSAMAVHHILPDELLSFPPSALAKAHLPTDMAYMIGHNVDYDWEALGQPACKRICTLAMSRFLWPANDGHSLGALSYQLATDLPLMREALKGAHGAAADVSLCAAVLIAMLEDPRLEAVHDWETLWQFSEQSRIPRMWTFGKFKGKLIQEADRGYMSWCLKQPDMDQYVKTAIHMAMRGELR